MAQQRLSMRKIVEVLRLKYEVKLSHQQIGAICGISASYDFYLNVTIFFGSYRF